MRCCCALQVYDRSALDAERDGITVCYNMLQQGVATAADMDDVDVKFRHVVEMAVSPTAAGLHPWLLSCEGCAEGTTLERYSGSNCRVHCSAGQ